MAKSKSELRKWLDGLAIEAADQTRLYDSSINKLYHCLSSYTCGGGKLSNTKAF
jgi:hypothetical protein